MITIRTFGLETGQQRPLVGFFFSLAAAKSCPLRISTVVFSIFRETCMFYVSCKSIQV